MNYWKQKAVPWVSISVLAGGMAAACILFLVSKIENSAKEWVDPSDNQFISQVEM